MTTYQVADLVALCVRHTDDAKMIAAEVAAMHCERDRLAAEKAELVKALQWFMTDKRFQIQVGGNPNAVIQMLEETRAILAKYSEQEKKP